MEITCPPDLLLLFLFLSIFLTFSTSQSELSLDYYKKTCPQFDNVMQQVVAEKQIAAPTTAAGTLRLFFHDCMVEGCDGSVLVSSTAFQKSERDAEVNKELPGDAFDLIVRAKTAIELQCPGIVSCSDILATVTRNLITMVGGPFYKVQLGRKDSLVSEPSMVDGHIAKSTTPLTEIIKTFADKGFSLREMVTLVGAHTIGFSHCKEFSNRLFNFSETVKTDPSLNPQYAEGLKKLCANYTQDPTMSAFNDALTPGKFDNMYYKNLQRGLGLLSSDQEMAVDERTKPIVDLFAQNETAFFEEFSRAIEKVGLYKIKTGTQGDVRRKCNEFNSAKTS